MANFLALYRGDTADEARLIAVTTEPTIVARFVRELGGEMEPGEDQQGNSPREALRLVKEDGVEY